MDNKKRARTLLAQKLRVLRFVRGWSQEALAEASGLHRTHISLIERGACNISLDNLEKLAGAFGLALPDLLGMPDAASLGAPLLATLTEPMKKKES